MDFIVSLLKSKWFWIIIAILILLIIINKNWDSINSKLFERKITSYAKDAEGNVIKISELDKPRLERLANNVKIADDDWVSGGIYASDLQPINELSDQELEYVAKYYKQAYSKSLYEVVNNATMPFTQSDEKLMTRLDQLALK